MKLVVKGRVQGVSYRASMQAKAALHGVDGWVRNLGDGSVEALLQGDEGDVRRVLEWSRLGPPVPRSPRSWRSSWNPVLASTDSR
jgi:acylphosphatase